MITDLWALYLINHTPHAETNMYAHANFYCAFSSAVAHDLGHTQTNRLVLQGKKAPTPHMHFYSLPYIIISNLQGTLRLAQILRGIFRA